MRWDPSCVYAKATMCWREHLSTSRGDADAGKPTSKALDELPAPGGLRDDKQTFEFLPTLLDRRQDPEVGARIEREQRALETSLGKSHLCKLEWWQSCQGGGWWMHH